MIKTDLPDNPSSNHHLTYHTLWQPLGCCLDQLVNGCHAGCTIALVQYKNSHHPNHNLGTEVPTAFVSHLYHNYLNIMLL